MKKKVAELASSLPPVLLDRVLALLPRARWGRPFNLLKGAQLKAMLGEQALPVEEAFRVFRHLAGLPESVRLEVKRLRGFLAAAQERGAPIEVLHAGGEVAVCLPCDVLGPAEARPITGTTRAVFAACFEDAIVRGRSGTVILGPDILFDFQGDELTGVPVELRFDPAVFAQEADVVHAIVDSEHFIELDQAWSLLGVNTVSFGHWMIEGLPQFLGARALPALAGVPILIDAAMPAQHREALELFGAGRFPIIPVPMNASVLVRRLWVTSNWHYTPSLLKTDQGIDPRHFVYPIQAYASLWRTAGAELDARVATAALGGGERCFIARSEDRHRSIVNHAEVAQRLQQAGFEAILPESYGFAEQAVRFRGAREIVVQSGSAVQILVLCRPGTRVAYLTHTSIPIIALLCAAIRALDIDMTIISGPIVNERLPYRDQSDYLLPMEHLDEVLARWGRHA